MRKVEFPVPADYATKPCRSCGAPVVWITTAATPKKPARYMPISAATIRRDLSGECVGESHFADCPNAAEHRRAR